MFRDIFCSPVPAILSNLFPISGMDTKALHAALRNGTLTQEKLQSLDRAQFMEPNPAGNTLLHAAARYGRLNDIPAEIRSP